MIVLFIGFIIVSILLIKAYKEIKRLEKCWVDVFNSKIDSDNKWSEMCKGYIETITYLRTENEKLKEKINEKNRNAKRCKKNTR